MRTFRLLVEKARRNADVVKIVLFVLLDLNSYFIIDFLIFDDCLCYKGGCGKDVQVDCGVFCF